MIGLAAEAYRPPPSQLDDPATSFDHDSGPEAWGDESDVRFARFSRAMMEPKQLRINECLALPNAQNERISLLEKCKTTSLVILAVVGMVGVTLVAYSHTPLFSGFFHFGSTAEEMHAATAFAADQAGPAEPAGGAAMSAEAARADRAPQPAIADDALRPSQIRQAMIEVLQATSAVQSRAGLLERANGELRARLARLEAAMISLQDQVSVLAAADGDLGDRSGATPAVTAAYPGPPPPRPSVELRAKAEALATAAARPLPRGSPGPSEPTAARGGPYRIQIAMLRKPENIEPTWRELLGKVGALPDDLQRYVTTRNTPTGLYHVLEVGPFETESRAISMCAEMLRHGSDCVVVPRTE